MPTGPATRAPSRRLLGLALRVAFAAAALAWTATRAPLGAVADAFGRLGAADFGVGLALAMATLPLAGARWWLVLAAFGAPAPPSVATLARLTLIGSFYNTFLPGNVAGDVLRAHTTERAFQGAAGAWFAVLLDRAVGFAALLTVSGSALAFGAPVDRAVSVGVLFGSSAAAIGVAAAAAPATRAVLSRVPAAAAVAARIPARARPAPLAAAFGIGLLIHAVIAASGHALVRAVDPQVPVHQSLVAIPLSSIAAYFPATVAGLGVREAAFAELYGRFGVAREDATAAAFGFLGVWLAVAAIGGATHLADALRGDER